MTIDLSVYDVHELLELLEESLNSGDLHGEDAALGRVLLEKLKSGGETPAVERGFQVETRFRVRPPRRE